jgi:hypothetical protein
MSGKAGASGKRSPIFTQFSRECPALTDTDSNSAYCEWIREQLILGNIDARTAEAMLKVSSEHMKSLRLRAGLHEMDDLRRMLSDMQAIKAETSANQKAMLNSTDVTTSKGRRKASN